MIMLAWAAPAPAQIQPTIEYEYYTIKAEEGRSLYDSLTSGTPLYHDGNRALGLTQSGFSLQKAVVEQPRLGLCRLRDIEVVCRCVISLPRLEASNESLQSTFAISQEKIKAHELEHCRITTLFANKYLETLINLDKIKCGRLDETIAAERQKISGECEAEQRRFDYRERYEASQLGRKMSEAQRKQAGEPPPPPPTPGPLKNLETTPAPGFVKGSDGVWRNY
jgi:predicted secreted Zn-dependent protease